jgi:hypothetical protein
LHGHIFTFTYFFIQHYGLHGDIFTQWQPKWRIADHSDIWVSSPVAKCGGLPWYQGADQELRAVRNWRGFSYLCEKQFPYVEDLPFLQLLIQQSHECNTLSKFFVHCKEIHLKFGWVKATN